MNLLGVDPGKSGGLVIIKRKINFLPEIIFARKMPTLQIYNKKIVDILYLNKELRKFKIDVVVIEKVHAMPRQGVTSSFQFGRSYGAIEGLCQMLSSRIDYVAPVVWKKAMGLGSSKQASLDLARMKFGDNNLWRVKSNDGIAEAALLCLFWIDKYSKA